ncbi:MAG: LuxR C-terminal-related transcriptional regulator [Chloroflexia bacterium]
MSVPEPLSEREMEVLRLVARGLTNEQIARELVISTNTVKVHLRNIFAKLGVASRTEASLYAVRQGWVVLEAPSAADLASSPAGEAASGTGVEEVLPRPRARPAVLRPLWAFLLLASVLVLAVLLNLSGLLDRLTPRPSPAPSPAPSFRRWNPRAGMPTPRGYLALVAFRGALYALGGYGPEGATSAVERFDPQEDTWISLAAKPTAVAEAQAAVLGGHIYVPGGRGGNGRPLSITEVYLVERNQWGTAAALPRPLCAYALAAFEGKLYLFGGWDGEGYREEILRYDPEADRWEEAGRLPFPLGYSGAVVGDDRIYLVGGVNDEGPLDVLTEYLPTLAAVNTQPLPGISLGRVNATLLYGDYLYVLAGSDPSAPATLWQYHLRSKGWQVTEPAPSPPYPGAALAGIGTELFVVGGMQGEVPLAQTLEYRAIFVVTPMPAPR